MHKELLYPYKFENRHPVFLDGVLFIPDFFTDEDLGYHKNFSCPDYSSRFNHPTIYIEYCAGNGQWIVEMAKRHPDVLWIAVEMKFQRVRKIFNRARAEHVSNLMIAFGMAEVFTKYYLPHKCISKVFVNFPDPWPKKKHAKHRLFQEGFLTDLKLGLKNSSTLTLATDDLPYMHEAVLSLSSSGFKPSLNEPYFEPLDATYGYSFFGDLWEKKGKTNYQTHFSYHD